jgi:hypothetical protein
MSNQYRKRRDLAGIVYLPDGSTLTDPNRVLTGARFAKYCPEFLEEVKDEDQSKLLTEDLPETGTGLVITEEPEVVEVVESPIEIPVEVPLVVPADVIVPADEAPETSIQSILEEEDERILKEVLDSPEVIADPAVTEVIKTKITKAKRNR